MSRNCTSELESCNTRTVGARGTTCADGRNGRRKADVCGNGPSQIDTRNRLILGPSRALSFLEALRPPVEQRGGADQIWTGLEGDAALSLRVLEVVDRGEMAVEQGRVGERPEGLGRLELRRIRRRGEEIDGFREVDKP